MKALYKKLREVRSSDNVNKSLDEYIQELESELLKKETRAFTKTAPRVNANKILRRNSNDKVFRKAIKKGGSLLLTDGYVLAKLGFDIDGIDYIKDDQVFNDLTKAVSNYDLDKTSTPMFVGDIRKKTALAEDDDYIGFPLNEDVKAFVKSGYLNEVLALFKLDNADVIKFDYSSNYLVGNIYKGGPLRLGRQNGEVFFMTLNLTNLEKSV